MSSPSASRLTPQIASKFAKIALGHVAREYPNKLDHVLEGPADARGPRDLHPIFYGSFDWHSCVHGYWLLASLLRREPAMPEAGAIRALLDQAFTPKNVAGEVAYLARATARGFERPYGWGWLLKLQAELMAQADAALGAGPPAARRRLRRAFPRVPAARRLSDPHRCPLLDQLRPGAGPGLRRRRRRHRPHGPVHREGPCLVPQRPRRPGLGAIG